MEPETKGVIEFTFERPKLDVNDGYSNNIIRVQDSYQIILNKYFKQVFNIEADNSKLKFNNLNVSTKDGAYQEYSESYKLDQDQVITKVLNQTANLRVAYTNKDGHNAFSFYIYNQNNCCGALSISESSILVHYQKCKLADILQYLKEDIAIAQKVSLLTCTDVYWGSYRSGIDPELKDLVPYTKNTKILLRNGWEVTKKFFNTKSNNVVALFTKNVPEYKERINSVTMKITKPEGKLIKIENLTIGTDPELFFRSKETGEFVPSFYVMKGDKHNPIPITNEGHAISCDNVMGEFSVPPSKTAEEFVKHNNLVLEYLDTIIARPNNLELVIIPYAEFKEADLTSSQATEFGCSPDFCVYSMGKANTVGKPSLTGRSAGGHIHIGYNNSNRVTNDFIIKALDLFISIPLVLMEPNNKRKEMYGRAGAYRTCSYGVEYRSPSNFIISSPEIMEWAFNQVQKAIEFLNIEGHSVELNRWSSTIEAAINHQRITDCNTIIEHFKINIIKVKETVKS